jgi:hypothetical protein
MSQNNSRSLPRIESNSLKDTFWPHGDCQKPELRVAIIGSRKGSEFIDDNSTGSVDIDMIPMTIFARGHVVAVSITLCVHDLIAR